MISPSAGRPIGFARVLGLFAKQPLPGLVKTRLAQALSQDWAGRIASAFLLDALDRCAAIEARRVLAFSPPGAQAYFADVANGRFQLIPQTEGDLGRRMAAFFAEQFLAGADAVVAVGTDSPTLPTAFIEEAFNALADTDVVLGPATDGGYYLIGCAQFIAPIFEGIAWGGGSVLRDTVERLAGTPYRLTLLQPWYDVDTLDDWRMLQGHVAALRRAGHDPGVPHTEQLLQCQIP